MLITRLALTSILISGLGCNSVDSDGVFTSALYASISATADGDGRTDVRATLYLESPGSLNYIELEGEDQLTAYGPDAEVRIMRESQFLGITSYSASFDVEDGDSEFIVDFSRVIDDSAPDSRVVLPTAFDIISADGVSYSRSTDDIVIEWGPVSTDDIDFQTSSSCVDPLLGSIEGDPGILTIAATDLVPATGENVPDTCEVVVTLTRSRAGSVDPAYGHGGDAYGYQRRVFTFTTAP